MQILKIKLKNCYGIQNLEYDFNFTGSNVYSLYAPNGFMKTSFSRAFSDLSANKDSRDLIFSDRISERVIQDENDSEISGENVFVIQSYDKDFKSDKTSLLLVNQAIKTKYDDALLIIEEKKAALVRHLKSLSGLSGRTVTPEAELMKCFEKESIFDVFESLVEDVNKCSDEELAKIIYGEVFNDKTTPFLESGAIGNELKEYIDKYNDLVDKSPILSRNFNHSHAKNVHKSLSENGFFIVNHSVSLFNGTEKEEITSPDELHRKIESEKGKIFSDKELSDKFEAIDKKLTNVELRKFRDYLLDNKHIVPQLSDYKKLQQDLWISYLANQSNLFLDLVNEYKSSKEVIKNAISEAKSERTAWTEVVDLFNKRFFVPFKMQVSNQDDVILKKSSPHISFIFSEQNEHREIDKNSLLEVISQGEKRALYILNILFELNARLKQTIPTILIIDDIADSFDYKNKYAIIEYIKDIAESDNFYLILLTHNFDFHRTISGRLDIPRENKLCAVKNSENLCLVNEKYQKDPFKFWKNNLTNVRFVISAIPFIRNLTEYCGLPNEYLKLTSLLHIKNDTRDIKVGDIESIYKLVLKDKPDLVFPSPEKQVINLIFEITEEILTELDSTAELESKVILSIAIRLKAEEFMINKIQDQGFVNAIKRNQTITLLERFRQKFPNDKLNIDLMEQVNLMTPENIHLNSFMYEPILDMSPEHLKELYKKIKEILGE